MEAAAVKKFAGTIRRHRPRSGWPEDKHCKELFVMNFCIGVGMS
jgi:hypothetical protein